MFVCFYAVGKIGSANVRLFYSSWIDVGWVGLGCLWLLYQPAFFKGKFNPSYYLHRKIEVIPILFTVASALFGMTFLCLYFPFTKNDVEVFKGKKKTWDRVDILKPKRQKFIKEEYPPMPELARIYAEMENEEKKLQEKCDNEE